jgi:uncharacterized membrane protein required for colicin V production
MYLDAIVALLILGMTYALASEGLWGAALMFFNALFAAMITLNFYEPLAQVIGTNVTFLSGYADALCILLIFTVSLLLMRLLTELLAPSMVRFPKPLYHIGRLGFALGGSLVTMGVMLLALDASPVNRKILGSMDHQSQPFFKVRLDKEVLAFFQYSTGQIFSGSGGRDPYKEYKDARVFDPEGKWLINAFQARPYGKETIFGSEDAAGEPAAKGAGGDAPAAQPPGRPGAPGGRGADRRGEGVPGGTAGAAVGLAPQ